MYVVVFYICVLSHCARTLDIRRIPLFVCYYYSLLQSSPPVRAHMGRGRDRRRQAFLGDMHASRV